MRVESPDGDGDDTAANGLEMRFCDSVGSWYTQETKMIFIGNWGNWRGWQMCPPGSYITSMNARVESHTVDDDTSLNGAQIRCRNQNRDVTETSTVDPGYWGSWSGWSTEPHHPALSEESDYFVNGAQMRYENALWENGDDTSANGIILSFTRNGFDRYQRGTVPAPWK
jgi:hypothetical protein